MLILNVFFVGMQLTIIFVIVKSDDYFLIKYFVYKMSKNSQYDRYNFQELSWLSCFGQQSLTLLLTLSYEEKCPSLMAEFTTLISLMSSCDWPLQPSAAVTSGCVSSWLWINFPASVRCSVAAAKTAADKTHYGRPDVYAALPDLVWIWPWLDMKGNKGCRKPLKYLFVHRRKKLKAEKLKKLFSWWC